MPYRTRAVLRIDTDAPLAGRLTVRSTRGVAADVGYFRAAARSARPGAAGPGRLAGLLVDPGPRRAAGAGRLVIDGRPAGNLAEQPGTSGVDRVACHWFVSGPVVFQHWISIEGAEGATVALFWYAQSPGPGRAAPVR
jgi:hypothetical protein